MACLSHDLHRSSIVKKNTKLKTFLVQDDMAEDKGSNTSCIGRAIHTLTTPGLITRTYTPRMHCQTFTFQTPLWLDNQQYKEAIEIPKQILIPSLLWLFNTSQHYHQSTVHSVLTT